MSDYEKQIERFYQGKLPSSEIIHIGMTPAILKEKIAHVKELPIIMSQSNLRKCIRAQSGNKTGHGITRDIIEDLPHQLENPVMITQNDNLNEIVILSGKSNIQGNPVVIAMHLEESFNFVAVNEIKSIYGKENAKVYLENKIKEERLIVIDNKKANELLRSIGLRNYKASLPKENITISYELTIQEANEKVNSCQTRKRPEIVQDIKKSGFQPSRKMIDNIINLDKLTKRSNSLKDISQHGSLTVE